MKILSFTDSQVVPNMSFLSVALDFHSMKNKYKWKSMATSNCLFANIHKRLCSAEERNSYRFETSGGWVNDDRIFFLSQLDL